MSRRGRVYGMQSEYSVAEVSLSTVYNAIVQRLSMSRGG